MLEMRPCFAVDLVAKIAHNALRAKSPELPMPFIMLPAISRYRALYPEVTIELTLSQRMPDLFEGNADVAVIGPPTLPDSELVSPLLGMIFVILCAAPTCVRANGASQEPGDLAHHECLILHTLVVPPHEQMLDGLNGNDMMKVNGAVHVNIAESLIVTIREGMVPFYAAISGLSDGKLVLLQYTR